MRSSRVLLAFVASFATLAGAGLSQMACGDLKRADESPDGAVNPGDEGGPPTEDGGVDADGGPTPETDAGPAPADFECDGDLWTKTTKTRPECAARRVQIAETAPALLATGISIAVTQAGRVGIVYNAEQGGETGELHLVHFVPKTPGTTPSLVKRAFGQYFHDGYTTKIAASGPDTLYVLSHDVEDISQSGEVRLAKLVNGAAPLTTPDVLATSVKRPTELGLAVDKAGTAYASIRISTGATTARLAVRSKTATGAAATLPDLGSALLPMQAPGAGSASLFVDPSNQLHLLYHYNEVMQHSTPRYHSLDGTDWSYRKTVDNAVIDGLCGFSPRVVTNGTKKYAAYFFRKALQSNPITADLRLATWVSTNDTPQIEIVDQKIPADDAQYPTYRVAMAIDKYGLIHLAIIRPALNPSSGYLEYRRQTPAAGGGTKWLSDIVDDDVLSASSEAYVDLVVDGNARPHIAYRSGKDNLVKYATRYDR